MNCQRHLDCALEMLITEMLDRCSCKLHPVRPLCSQGVAAQTCVKFSNSWAFGSCRTSSSPETPKSETVLRFELLMDVCHGEPCQTVRSIYAATYVCRAIMAEGEQCSSLWSCSCRFVHQDKKKRKTETGYHECSAANAPVCIQDMDKDEWDYLLTFVELFA